jgi:phosphatidylinositol alpha-1,6-mannosyltransferase
MLITQDFPPKIGGIEVYSYQLANEWKKQGKEVIVVTVSQKNQAEQEARFDKMLPYKVIRFDVANPILLGQKLKKNLASLINEHQVNCVFHSQWQTAKTSIALKIQGLLSHVFVAVHGRELLFNPYASVPFMAGYYSAKMRKVFNNCDQVFSNSRYVAALLNDLGLSVEPRAKTTVTGLGVNEQDFPLISKSEALSEVGIDASLINTPVILSITRIIHRKGADLVLHALAKFAEKHPDTPFFFIIGGEGPFEKVLKKLTKKLNLSDKVAFVGPYQYDQLYKVFRASDIFVMPSRSDVMDIEGYGIVFLEAAICGLPSIGSHSGGIPDAVEQDTCGYLIEEANVDELAEKIEYLIINKKARKTMGDNAKKRADEMTWERVADKIFNRMKEIINA